MITRDAVSTIRGYFYQFDYSIIKILSLEHDADTICIEGIEDVDISDQNNITLHQCKCYEATEYNHSIIAPAIRWMLKHYSENKDSNYKYYVYGVFKSGQEKLKTVTVKFAKTHFFTYIKDSIKHTLHDELSLKDCELSDFVKKLVININAESYNVQEQNVRKLLCSSLDCNMQETELYYCNALSVIKQLATNKDESKRKISRENFIQKVKNVNNQFEMWLLHKKGKEQFAKMIKKKYFTNINVSPYARFFLLECNKNTSIVELKNLVLDISRKYSKLSKNAKPRFCPYFCFYGIDEQQLIKLKNYFATDNIRFSDGYDFRGANFSYLSVIKEPYADDPVKFKIIDKIDFLQSIFNSVKSTIEIYQFYNDKIYYEHNENKHIKIPFENVNDIADMV